MDGGHSWFIFNLPCTSPISLCMDIMRIFWSLVLQANLLSCITSWNLFCFSEAISISTSGNETDRIALIAFKDQISSDPFGVMSSWNDSLHFCHWGGIVCTQTLPQRVVQLNLRGQSLVGIITPFIANLTSLTTVDLSRNAFHGVMPQEFGCLRHLQHLNLTHNSLQGEIPVNLTQCSHLRTISFDGNKLVGNIPIELASLPQLVELRLDKNNLTGSIPPSFGNLSSLTVLSLGYNQLVGSIPPDLGQLRNLNLFQVGDNILSELLKATNGFSSANLIGVGSHGSVYKGSLNSNEEVAVKVINLQERSAYRSFTAECEALSKIRHRNIVKIVTVCSSLNYEGGNFRALVYKYMPNESLDKWLHPNTEEKHHSRTLSLIQRINIAIDVASALDYLHHHYHAQIVHCDIKPSNILLDDNMTAYLSDFGLAKVLSECACAKDSSQHKTSSVVVKGTIGYIAPEYGRGGKISTKGDVYCYGILLLEMLTGRRPTDTFKDDQSLHQFARTSLDTDRVMENVDPQLLSKDVNSIKSSRQATSIINQCLISLMRTGVKCSERLPEERRDMTEVVKMLHQIKDAYLGNVSITK